MAFQDLGGGVYRVGGARRSASTGRFVLQATAADPVQDRPLLIVAATVEDGAATAAQIAVEHFTIITPRSHAQVGRVIRGVVMTPSFAALLEANDRAASRSMSAVRIDARKSGVGWA